MLVSAIVSARLRTKQAELIKAADDAHTAELRRIHAEAERSARPRSVQGECLHRLPSDLGDQPEGQLNERRQCGTGAAMDGHRDVPGVHVCEPEQGEHRFTMQVRTFPHAQECLRELVVARGWDVSGPVAD
jgi:hypothetical protein